MLEDKLDALTAQLKRVADALEGNNGAPSADPEPEKPKRKRRTKAEIAAEKAAAEAAEAEAEEDDEEEEEEETPPPKKTARKTAKKATRKTAKKAPEPEPEDEEDEDEFDDSEEEEDEGPIDYKKVADHIRKTREGLIKKNGTKGVLPHKKITKQLLDDWGVGKVSEIDDEQIPEFYQDLRAAEEEAGI